MNRQPLTLQQIDQWPLRAAWRWDVVCRWAICNRCCRCCEYYKTVDGIVEDRRWDRKQMRRCVVWGNRKIGGYMQQEASCAAKEMKLVEKMWREKELWGATIEQFAHRMGCRYESTEFDGHSVLLLTPVRLNSKADHVKEEGI